MRLLKTIFYNNWILSLIIAIPVIALLPLKIDKFKTSLVSKIPVNAPYIVKYADLNHDGHPEKIQYFENAYHQLAFQVYDSHGGLFDQWNFPGEYYRRTPHVYTGDYDHDGWGEIVGFSKTGDSIWMNYVKPLAPGDPSIHSVFIDTVKERSGYPPDLEIPDARFIDIDGDSADEFVFIIEAGYSLEPRKVYYYDFQDKSLHESPRAGEVIDKLEFADLDHDGRQEIFGMCYSNFNFPDSADIPYPDHSAYLFVYDDDLQFLFPPVGYLHSFSNVFVKKITELDSDYLLVLYSPFRYEFGHPVFQWYTPAGKLVGQDSVSFLNCGARVSLLQSPDHRLYIRDDGFRIYEINPKAHIIRSSGESAGLGNKPDFMDLNGDGKFEIVTLSNNSTEITIISPDLNCETDIPLDENNTTIVNVSQYDGNLFLQTTKNEYFYSYAVNPMYYIRYPLYLVIYFGIFLFVYFIKKVQEARAREKYAFLNQVMNLEMKAFNNQMDPHFMMNTFNLVAGLLNKGDSEKALDAFMKFSNLVRQNLIRSDDLTRTLGEELDSVKSFLEITKLRFRDKISYAIRDGIEDLKKVMVPKMIILTHVENAVKHGLIPKTDKGSLKIDFSQYDDTLRVTIEDDGIGREQSAMVSRNGSGKGLELLGKLISLLNDGQKNKIRQEIIDLKDPDGDPSGTKVLLLIPFGLN